MPVDSHREETNAYHKLLACALRVSCIVDYELSNLSRGLTCPCFQKQSHLASRCSKQVSLLFQYGRAVIWLSSFDECPKLVTRLFLCLCSDDFRSCSSWGSSLGHRLQRRKALEPRRSWRSKHKQIAPEPQPICFVRSNQQDLDKNHLEALVHPEFCMDLELSFVVWPITLDFELYCWKT